MGDRAAVGATHRSGRRPTSRSAGAPPGPARGHGPLVAAALVFLVLIPLGLSVRAGWAPARPRRVDQRRARGPRSRHRRRHPAGAHGTWAHDRSPHPDPSARGLVGRARRWQLVAFVVVGGLAVTPVNRALKAIFDRDRPSYRRHDPHGRPVVPERALVWCSGAGGRPRGRGVARAGRDAGAGSGSCSPRSAWWSSGTPGSRSARTSCPTCWPAGPSGVAWVLLVAVALDVWPGRPGALPTRRIGGSSVSARILVVQHEEICPLGRLESWLAEAGIEARRDPAVRRRRGARPSSSTTAWWCSAARWAPTTTTRSVARTDEAAARPRGPRRAFRRSACASATSSWRSPAAVRSPPNPYGPTHGLRSVDPVDRAAD